MDDNLQFFADSHCHLDVGCTSKKAEDLADVLNDYELINHRSDFFHVMSSNHIDAKHLELILTRLNNTSIIPYFGVHPWYSHLFTDLRVDDFEDEQELKRKHYGRLLEPQPPAELLEILPIPLNIDDHIKEMNRLVCRYENSGFRVGIGEIGLDKLFRIPANGFFGNQSIVLDDASVKLTPCKVSMDHQVMVFTKQLSLANVVRKPVSIHCVKAHGLLYDKVTGSQATQDIPSIILHSYSGSPDQAGLWIRHYAKSKQNLYFSLSNCINGTENKRDTLEKLVTLMDNTQILLETDVGIDKYLLLPQKKSTYFDQLTEIFNKICAIKNLDHCSAKEIICSNWKNSVSLDE